MEKQEFAPDGPGILPKWTSSSKSGVGTAYNSYSKVWFTISHGILNEIYFPRLDTACTRDMEFIVTDGKDFFSEEKRSTKNEIKYLSEGIPAYKINNTCNKGFYKIKKEIIADPDRDCVLQKVNFKPLKKNVPFHLYALLAPHIRNHGAGNNGWVGDYKGIPMLFAERDGITLAMACSIPWKIMTTGFAGTSDGWQDLYKNKIITKQYAKSENGNIALTGEIDLENLNDNPFVICIAFGENYFEAGQKAAASIFESFENIKEKYINEWQNWQEKYLSFKNEKGSTSRLNRVSASILQIHQAKSLKGGIIASLSIPWGFAKGDDDLGGYHLAWPRDLAEAVGGLLTLGSWDDAFRVLNYLVVTQEEDGHWAQNMWLDGSPYWKGIQLDETAFPILLLDLAKNLGRVPDEYLDRLWPMVKKAASYLVKNGPVTQEDRWEEDAGFSPFTLAVEIAALLIAAEHADIQKEKKLAEYLRETADIWNDQIERWIYSKETDLAKKIGVEGYYIRISPPDVGDGNSLNEEITIYNRILGTEKFSADEIISPDALALVRFGLRSADDPRIINTVKVIDKLLRIEFPTGSSWHRYNNDGYGEHEDGSAFDGTGVGRAWPLLTGERAHYEIAAGNFKEAKKLKKAMESFANEGGMLPEQLWDSDDIPEKELFFGKPSGSAMPLVWAHAEYLKLCISLQQKKVFDMPAQTYQRYVVSKTTSKYFMWRFNTKCRTMPKGKILRIEVADPCEVNWSFDNWKTKRKNSVSYSGLGMYFLDLNTKNLNSGDKITFTFYWTEVNKWENKDYSVEIE
jgi:glucoamylase